ncbi:MAG: GDCCVxC domain-containing (seleno)protein [Xanthobacteraceae bacterium]
MQTESTLTCPRCGYRSTEQMPADACRFFYVCEGCGETLRPLPGDCCVFCSYGSVPCPPVQGGGRHRGRASPR